jgi:RNA polymerase sigma-70 factor (ECF subfamily)
MSQTHSEVAAAKARAAAEAAARQSYGKLVAYLAARSRDVAGAEDALSEAFAAALAQWPHDGVPAKPEAWLMSVAKRRGIDAVRRRQTTIDARAHLALIAEEAEAVQASPDDIPDERLRLRFACAHPAIEPGIRAPLILQTLLGFDAAAIASAFLVSPATMAQRLVRAKARIKEAGIPFRVPESEEIGERLGAVLEAIYAAYSEGWGDPGGIDDRRRNLATEAIWLGRLAAALMPEEAEAESLVALMLFAEARRPARRDVQGRYVPLGEQNFSLWDAEMIGEAETRLRRAGRLEGPGGKLGRYQLEAAVQAVHAARRLTGRTDWAALVTLYDALATMGGSPVVTINRAVAIAELPEPSGGPQVALAELDAIAGDRRLADYQPYWAARAGLLARLGDAQEAALAYERAIGLERDPAVRAFLAERKAGLVH